MYFSATNPAMKYGGVMGESKFKVLGMIPGRYLPRTMVIRFPISISSILHDLANSNIIYPFIIKPDVGERGKDVELIGNEEQLCAYLTGKTQNLIVQEYIGNGLEFGILFYRYPGEAYGRVTSVTSKGYLTITGNGQQTLRQLIKNEIRAVGRIDYLSGKYRANLDEIIPKGHEILLEPIGNHCRGTVFYNANHLINQRLHHVLNSIALEIEGFFYGRFDLKVPTIEDLYDGRNIRILELNGVSSEVAHIYDPEYSLWKAYKDVFWHMKIIWQIARENNRNGQPYDRLWPFLTDLKAHLTRK